VRSVFVFRDHRHKCLKKQRFGACAIQRLQRTESDSVEEKDRAAQKDAGVSEPISRRRAFSAMQVRNVIFSSRLHEEPVKILKLFTRCPCKRLNAVSDGKQGMKFSIVIFCEERSSEFCPDYSIALKVNE